MDPKFLVIEIDSKEQALQLVQVMLEKGFARLMLLDDIGKHPSLVKNTKDDLRETASSPIIFEEERTYPAEENFMFPTLNQESNATVSSTVVKQEPLTTNVIEEDEPIEEEEEEMVLTSRRPTKRVYDNEDNGYREQLMNMLRGEPEIVPIGVNAVRSNPSVSSLDSQPKRSRTGEYHECRLCGVRVKSPRSGRWNLQMHVIALHCVGRQYRCKECDYLDYRKSTMRKHTVSQHGRDIPPHNITDDIMKSEWHEAMMKCFPEFAHRTGFLS